MTRQKLKEEVAWWLAVVAAGLLCLVLLPLYPLCWVVARFENEFRDERGRLFRPGGVSRRALLFCVGGTVREFSMTRRGGWVLHPTRPPRRVVGNSRCQCVPGWSCSVGLLEFSMPRRDAVADKGTLGAAVLETPWRPHCAWKSLLAISFQATFPSADNSSMEESMEE